MAKKRIGLLGGSFDPVHVAHLALAQAAQQQLRLDEVQFIPAAQPWQKSQLGANSTHRVAMLELATQPYPTFKVNTTEIQRGGPTYTYDTVATLPASAHYFWLLGADQLQNFTSWHRWQDILQHVDLAVAQRPGSALTPPEQLSHYLAEHNKNIHYIDFKPSPISATLIRERLHQDQSVAQLVPDSVLHYLTQHQLYQP
ncbi:MAG: nicotinate (nicotinamide) nucleotide adenylyltransferase [Alcaligenaceae bacterium]|nr:nicotinate (nicotinamide) nucleotide adenylyltransferase [Alcaligenaceae bacterium]